MKCVPLGTIWYTEISPFWLIVYAQIRICSGKGNVCDYLGLWDTLFWFGFMAHQPL